MDPSLRIPTNSDETAGSENVDETHEKHASKNKNVSCAKHVVEALPKMDAKTPPKMSPGAV